MVEPQAMENAGLYGEGPCSRWQPGKTSIAPITVATGDDFTQSISSIWQPHLGCCHCMQARELRKSRRNMRRCIKARPGAYPSASPPCKLWRVDPSRTYLIGPQPHRLITPPLEIAPGNENGTQVIYPDRLSISLIKSWDWRSLHPADLLWRH